MAWAGSHPQSYPKPENVWKIENVNNQIKEKGENVSKNEWKVADEGNTLFDLGNDEEFPPLIKEITQEENLEAFSFIENEKSMMEKEENESSGNYRYECNNKELVNLRKGYFEYKLEFYYSPNLRSLLLWLTLNKQRNIFHNI